ncbi:MAG: MFS transporter, partial [Holophagales bacterium]|nr:MFS transporter [Holophagales bacterium]
MTPDHGYSRRWEILLFTSVGAFMAPLDGSIVSVALPVMGQQLGLSFEGTLWVQAAYLLTMAVLVIPLGRLADQRGRLKFYLAGTALFTLGSLGAAMSIGSTSIILARILQGSGGALLSSTSAALVTAAFPPDERGKAIGINVMSVYVGLSIGPPLGGFLVDGLSWHWIFLINIPVGIAILLWGWRLRRVVQESGTEHKLDLLGSMWLSLAMIALLLPLTLHAQWGLTSAPTLTLFTISIISFVAFTMREKSVSEPLIDLSLLRSNRQFAFGNIAALLTYISIYAVGLLTSVWLQLVQGLSAKYAGWIMLGQPVVQSMLSPATGRLSDRIDARILTFFGMLMIALGMALLACFAQGASFATIIAALAVVGIGMASFNAPNSNSVMGSVGRHQLGLAGAFL